MRHEVLTEYKTTGGVPLTVFERDALRELVPSLSVEPTTGIEGTYDLTPGSTIGTVRLENLSVEIRPKLEIQRVLFLLSYALAPDQWKEMHAGFDSVDSLVDAIVPGFAFHVRQATRRGLLHGYRAEEDALPTVRGRVRFGDQIRDRLGVMPPVEVAFDEFTEDIFENRLIKAAIDRLCYRDIRSNFARQLLRDLTFRFAAVERMAFDSRNLPAVRYSRLNAHYRFALELAKLILRSTSWDLQHGRHQASAFLVDMNMVFEEFVTVALRESLNLTEHNFPSSSVGHPLYLDQDCRVALKPDISWWSECGCVFVGDVKYKNVEVKGFKHADLYQLLAYTTATGLRRGLLIYANGEAEPQAYVVEMAGKLLEVAALDLAGAPEQVLAQIDQFAERIQVMANEERRRNVSLRC